jgi:hypothetical protein
VAEWLRRLTRNQFRSAGVGSNPTDRECFCLKSCVSVFFFADFYAVVLCPIMKHRWFSGRMLACHAGGPGSIPGRCRHFFSFPTSPSSFAFWPAVDTVGWTDLESRGKLCRGLNQNILGDAGYRSPYLSHAKRALYHLSYVPWVSDSVGNGECVAQMSRSRALGER